MTKKTAGGTAAGDQKPAPIVPASSPAAFNPEHQEKLSSSALPQSAIDRLRWRSLRDGRLEIDYLRPDGQPEICSDGKPFQRWRSAAARIKNGAPKYLSPKGEGCRIYHPHVAVSAGNYSSRIQDRNVPLRITEGELKAEAAALHDPERLTIAIGGVDSWVDHRAGGEQSRPLPELESIPLSGRQVRLCFDSDYEKPSVAAALQRLAEWLAEQGAHVLIEVLPNGLSGDRLGLDDLIDQHGPETFRAIAAIARCPFKERRRSGETEQYWSFNPEPLDTHERNVYLFGMLGQQWRSGTDARDAWQQWTGSCWENVTSDDHLSSTVERFMALQGWRNRELTTVRSLLAAFRRSIAPAAENSAVGLLPLRNGCLRLADRVLLPHSPANGNTWVLPYDYDPQAGCSVIQAFLEDRLGDPASVAVFRAFARSLLVSDRLKCFMEITGPSNTGKSVLANLLQALVGTANTAACTLQRIEDRTQRFETLKLRGKRLAVFSECQDFAGQLQVLKALTGGDPIGAEVKNGRHIDFTYTGGVVLVGNGPIRATDPTGAVINRRRSLSVHKVVAASAERQLLDPDGCGGWRGELAGELPGLVNWCLYMSAAEARTALARDVRSVVRAEAELDTLLSTDFLAEWADQRLSWHEGNSVRVGHADNDADEYIYPDYLRWLDRQGRNCKPLSLRSFKSKLIDLLRDTLSLPLPPGKATGGEYRVRNVGSVVPHLRLKRETEETPGVIRHAFMARISGTDAERIGNGKTPLGNGWNGRNESEPLLCMEESELVFFSYRAERSSGSVPSVPSIPCSGSQRSASVPPPPTSVPQGTPIEVRIKGEWQRGWRRLGGGKGSASVLCSDPQGRTVLRGKDEIRAEVA